MQKQQIFISLHCCKYINQTNYCQKKEIVNPLTLNQRTVHTSLQKVSRVPNRRTVRRYEKVFLNICVKIFFGHVHQKL